MPKIPRSVILSLASCASGGLLTSFLSPRPAISTDCIQWARETVNSYVSPGPAPGEPIGGYYDVRTHKDVPIYRQGEAPASQQAGNNVPINGSLTENYSQEVDTMPAPASEPAPAPAPAYSDGTLSRDQRLAGSMDMIDGGYAP